MKTNHLKNVALMFFSCLAFCNSNVAAKLTLENLEQDKIKLTYTPVVKFDTVKNANTGEKYLLPVIDDAFFAAAKSGSPMLMQHFYKLKISAEDAYFIEDYTVHSVKSLAGKIAPVPSIIRDENEIANEIFLANPELYSQTPGAKWVDVEYSGISRGQHFASIIFTAAKYNSQTESIEIPTQIDITIKLNPAKLHKPEPKLLSNLQNLDDLSDGNWFRFGIKEEGIYRLSAADLANNGINIPADKIATIKIFGGSGEPLSEIVSDGQNNILQEQEIIVTTKKDGTLDYITFYAAGSSGLKISSADRFKYPTHYLNFMDNNNYYLFTFGGAAGKRATAISQATSEAIHKPRSYLATIYHEEDLIMPYSWGGGRIWFGASANKISIVHTLHNLARNSSISDITYLFSAAHVSGSNGEFNLSLGNNSNLSSKLTLHPSNGSYVAATLGTSNYFSFPIDAIPNDNLTILNVDYAGANVGISYLNYYELHYPREFVPIDDEITFFTDKKSPGTTEYNINGFSGEIFGFDITDASSPKLLANNASTGGMFIFKTESLADKNNRYFIASRIKNPISFEKIEMDNLRGKAANADVIVITHNSLLSSAEKFAEYRTKQSNYKIKVVTLDKIYNEFSHGRYDLTAIRDYVQYAYNNWATKPQYVVLWGLGHYDYRGLEYKTNNFVPSYQRDFQLANIQPARAESLTDNQSCYATDEFFVCVEGNDWFPDLAVGRVPITSNEQGEIYIAKLNKYENKSDNGNWRNNIILLADDDVTTSGPEGPGYHCRDAEKIADRIPTDFTKTKIYAVTYPEEIQGGARRKPKVTQEFLNDANVNGASVFFYTGHGNPNRLMHEDVLVRESTLNQFNNTDKFFYFMASSCEVGRFDKSGSNCIGTEIVTLPNTGAIASISATRVSGISSNAEFHCYMYDSLFNKTSSGEYITIGEAARLAKNRYHSSPDAEALMYVTLGDPTLRLIFPMNDIVATSINSESLLEDSAKVVEIKALSKITLAGEIRDTKTAAKLNDFNGTVIVILDEAELDVVYQCTHSDLDKHYFKQKGATINKTAFSVKNGEFVAEFVIPADISFSEKNAILYLYAFSFDSTKFAQGVTNQLKINDINSSVVNDNSGPEVSVYLDSRIYFNDGEVVSKTPLLLVDISDETGINATGLGIGHHIEAWIDENPNPIDLTPRYISSMTEPNAGSISEYLYGLSAGRHTIKVRAWDVFNNYGTGNANFVTPENDGDVFYAAFCNNPISRKSLAGENLAIRHNFMPPIDVELEIFDILGNLLPLLRNNNMISATSAGILPISSLIDISKIGTGTYYYRVRCTYNGGKNSYEKFGCLGVIVD